MLLLSSLLAGSALAANPDAVVTRVVTEGALTPTAAWTTVESARDPLLTCISGSDHRIRGLVTLQARIGASGVVGELRLLSDGHPDEADLPCVRAALGPLVFPVGGADAALRLDLEVREGAAPPSLRLQSPALLEPAPLPVPPPAGVAGLGEPGAGGLASRGGGLGTGGASSGLEGLGTRSSTPPPPAPGTVAVGAEASVVGPVDRAGVDAVIQKNLPRLLYCYQRELAKAPALAGTVKVELVVSRDGTVSSATTKSSTLKNATVETCLNSRFLAMTFPPPEGGGVGILTYPFVFSPE